MLGLKNSAKKIAKTGLWFEGQIPSQIFNQHLLSSSMVLGTKGSGQQDCTFGLKWLQRTLRKGGALCINMKEWTRYT